MDESYPGGLAAYLSKAKLLLKESADGVNPFEDYEAQVPEGESLSVDGEGTMPFSEAEEKGIEAMAGATFVLVAGGLGERLGYSGIKLSLETNLCTNESYLELYIRYIQAMLGHVKLETTAIYAQVSIRKLKEIHNATHPAKNERNGKNGKPKRIGVRWSHEQE